MSFIVTLLLYFSSCFALDLDPNLSKIIELQNKSLQVSPELKVTRNYRLQKGAEAYTRFSDFLPHANFTLKKEKDFYEERNSVYRSLGLSTYNSTWGIDYRWSILNYGIIQNARKSFTEKDKAELNLMIKESEYPIAFTTYLLNYILAKYKTAAVENSLKKAETGKREAKLGFEIGQKTKLDVLRSEANMVSLDSKKTTFLDEEQNTKSKFLEYSGLESSDLDFLSHLDESQTLALINQLSSSNINKNSPSFEHSPLIKNLEYEEKVNSLALSNITTSQWPDLSIQGAYANAGDSISKSFSHPYRTHSIALVLTIPLFGGGNLVSSQFEEYFAKQQLIYTSAQKKLETQNKLSNTLIKINALETLVSSLTLNVSQYEELYRLTVKSYQLGKSTLIELLEVQDNLLDAKINLAQNKIQLYSLSQNYLWQAGLK